VNTVREDPVRKGLLFAGTETAVWISFDDGDHWQSLQLNLPPTSMRDLWIHDDDLIVATHGRSFWILDDIASLRQMSPDIPREGAHLFTPASAYRVRRDTNTDTPLPADEPAGQNPPGGAPIDYLLSQPSSGTVTLEILDLQGKLVRRYSSDDKPEQTPEDIKKQLIPPYWLRPQHILSAGAGMHRWVWDLRYPHPYSTLYEYPISAVPHDTPRNPSGPLVLPGKYIVKLTANGKTQSSSLTVKMDPRVKTTATGLKDKFYLEMRLASAISRDSEAVSQARSMQEQLAGLEKKQGSFAEQAKQISAKLSLLLDVDADSGQPTLKTVNNDAINLYKESEKADDAPTAAQVNAEKQLGNDLMTVLKEWNGLKTKDLTDLNRQLATEGIPQIRLDLPPREEETGENEE